MSSHPDSEDASEWRLPWWLKFLDKTNATVTALTAGFVLYTQSVGAAYFGAGATACLFSVKIVKKMVRQDRPLQRKGKKQKKTYGMPSTHSATMTYYATYILLASLYLPIHRTLPQSWITRIGPPLVVLPWATVIALSRIWLGHHTLAQVSVGCTFGFVFALSWFAMWTHGLNEQGLKLEHLWESYPWS
ncbi:PAP2-domain-containing protein [Gymnopus androsaceus JB14]|uniref:PAP2-domain-containing protein n=1 Tax=Gymnopus androsaceus JB14 TaxID=1447944 RepID=A0A6A4HE29_9AGAR|nr:PAP2-domain-containing protein [Gymnopus androsaceus JB14]